MFTQRSIIFPKIFRDHSGDAAIFREGSICRVKALLQIHGHTFRAILGKGFDP